MWFRAVSLVITFALLRHSVADSGTSNLSERESANAQKRASTTTETVTTTEPATTTSITTTARPTSTTEIKTTETTTTATTTTATTTTEITTTEDTTTTEATTTPGVTTTTGVTTTPGCISTSPDPHIVPKFVLQDGNISCVILEAKLMLIVHYFSDKSNQSVSFLIPWSSVVTGKCGSESETLVLSWIPINSDVPFNLSMKFVQLPKSASSIDSSIIQNLKFQYFLSKDVFPGTNSTGPIEVSAGGSFFETPSAAGYTCTGQQNITLHGSHDVTLVVSLLHIEAFRNSSSVDFDRKAVDCVIAPTSNNIIPILVGVFASIVILLAVVAFLIRNRRRAQGYQSL